MKKQISITTIYEIEYEHNDHFSRLFKDLENGMLCNSSGVGVASDGIIYPYKMTILPGMEVNIL